MISAQILADSVSVGTRDRITTFLLSYPRFIHEELLTHRVLSRNSPSSRAIPSKRLVDAVRTDPAMPVWWGKNRAGMQATEEMDQNERAHAVHWWTEMAKDLALLAEEASTMGLHKQLANRILHPVQQYGALVTATEWDGFWLQRAHPAAQPEFQDLAYAMLAAYLESEPEEKGPGEWHMPFAGAWGGVEPMGLRLKIATARAARLSYLTFDGTYSPQEDYALHDNLARMGHWSPFEHCAMPWRAPFRPGAMRNFRGWVPYREMKEPQLTVKLSRDTLYAILASRPVRDTPASKSS